MTSYQTSSPFKGSAAYDYIMRYPRFKLLHSDITECQHLSKLGGEPQCMALEGPTGVGKTTLVRDYTALFPTVEREDGRYIPVFYMLMPAPASIKDTASKMLESMGDPVAHRGTTGVLTSRLIKLIPACGIELIILDEFHHLIDSESDKVLSRIADWLKVLIKETGVPFLVVGHEEKVERILKVNDQLSRLFAVREVLYPFSWDHYDGEANIELAQFVKLAEELVERPLSPELSREEWLWRMQYATNGIVANLMNLIRGAALAVLKDEHDHLSLEAFKRAFDKRLAKHMTGKLNPFGSEHGDKFVAPPESTEQAFEPNKARGRHSTRPQEPSTVLTTKH